MRFTKGMNLDTSICGAITNDSKSGRTFSIAALETIVRQIINLGLETQLDVFAAWTRWYFSRSSCYTVSSSAQRHTGSTRFDKNRHKFFGSLWGIVHRHDVQRLKLQVHSEGFWIAQIVTCELMCVGAEVGILSSWELLGIFYTELGLLSGVAAMHPNTLSPMPLILKSRRRKKLQPKIDYKGRCWTPVPSPAKIGVMQDSKLARV
jgi:hypothetical protein